ncbi:5' nucleotidase, NT5C type [Flagellimonas meridianipacifica]|uniref:5'(3')-deoxyribonucleotidase n=1 Tax=Flagellimonas meridianipacifica TaxID=1080225 RepID=A0A2T0MCY3_9FLAO|nr:5'(3')-deoxyribonucleotidase [Allomuricauda pacifica]PRX55334.1 5'(3')-deoxyribonucleotidase [Allomuricauda pacifica]
MTLFVDMDEVLADTYQAHIDVYNSEFGASLTREECYGKEVWQCVPEEHQQSVRQHAHTRGFFKELPVIENSSEVLEQLNEKYKVYIASAAMQFPNSLEEKSDWLDNHFSFIPWQRRILCGYKHILKGDLLIDDRSYNLERFNGKTILFTSPHNVNTKGFDRANTWLEIADKLL